MTLAEAEDISFGEDFITPSSTSPTTPNRKNNVVPDSTNMSERLTNSQVSYRVYSSISHSISHTTNMSERVTNSQVSYRIYSSISHTRV